MKILHVIETMAPQYGGPVTVVGALAEYQAAAGHTVEICTTNRDYPTGILRDGGGRPNIKKGLSVNYFPVQMPSLKLSMQMGSYLKGNVRKFDIVHIHGLYRFPPTYAAYQARRQDVPYIIRPFGALSPHLRDRSAKSLLIKRLYERLFDAPNIRGADAIHYTTDEERIRSSEIYPSAQPCVIPNGIDWMQFETLPDRGLFRSRLGLGSEPVVLFVGRVHPVKGLEILIDAFASIRQHVGGAKLVIVGPENDGYGDTLRLKISKLGLDENVLFAGHLEGSELTKAYVDADVFALPSYGENFGMTVVEAMACGVPVVISDAVAIRDHVARADAGTVTALDCRRFGSAIVELLRDPDRRNRMGKAGRKAAKEAYEWAAVVDRVTEKYMEVIRIRAART